MVGRPRTHATRFTLLACTALALSCTFGCAALPPGSLPQVGSAANSMTISPALPSVRAGATQQFSATVVGLPNPSIVWSVNGTPGGNSLAGTITSDGNYTAPAVLPNPNTVTVAAAISQQSLSSSATVTLLNPVPQLSALSPTQVDVGALTITVTGANFVNGAVVNLGGMPLATNFVSGTQLTAIGTATSQMVGSVQITVTNPNPGSATSGPLTAQIVQPSQPNPPVLTAEAADRFLGQATFGPTTALITQVQQSGFQGFLNQQFALAPTAYATPAPSETNVDQVQNRFFVHAITAPDQLRQRVAFALSEIFVVSGTTVANPTGYTQYLTALQNDAFTNYRQIMQDVTLSPVMGHYLDMVDNGKPTASTDHANENFAREMVQLFTIGTAMLNSDGSQQTDSTGEPIPTYSQATVEAFSLAYTGWTYPTAPGATPQEYNPPYWIGQMVADDANHDTTAKQLLQYPGVANGGALPAGQTAMEDLNGALDNIFNHPNVGPFICRQLIQHLVTSNPSPAYVQRIAAVFANNGSGVRGDMKAVVTAILLDSEARRGDDPSTANPGDGHLQEPVLFIAGIYRALGATTDGTNLPYFAGTMGEPPLEAPSVFNFFSPSFMIPGTQLNGPEFQILTTATALARANFVNSFVYGTIPNTAVDFSPLAAQTSNPTQLLASLSALMMHGTMSSDMQSSIITAMQVIEPGSTQAKQQAQMALYLVATSSQYQVQH